MQQQRIKSQKRMPTCHMKPSMLSSGSEQQQTTETDQTALTFLRLLEGSIGPADLAPGRLHMLGPLCLVTAFTDSEARGGYRPGIHAENNAGRALTSRSSRPAPPPSPPQVLPGGLCNRPPWRRGSAEKLHFVQQQDTSRVGGWQRFAGCRVLAASRQSR